MKIRSIDIAAFGKFKNFHLDFSDNMTVIFGENENGKSTIMAFIRMMFYGNTGKTSDIDKNPRIKYRPWDSELMAGSITFSHGGIEYRLEREFKRSNSADKITLIDLDTGNSRSLSGSDDIGAKFFGLTDAAFERSVFISEAFPAAKNDAAGGEINSRLSNSASTGTDEVSFEKISQRLQKAKEQLFSKSGKKGLCDKAALEKDSLLKQIREAENTEEELSALKLQISLKEKELSENSAESAKLFELLKNTDKIKKKIFTEKYLEACEALEESEEKLRLSDGNIADEGFLEKAYELKKVYISSVESLDTQTARTEKLRDEVNSAKATLDALKSSSGEEERAGLVHLKSQIDKDIDDAQTNITDINKKLEALRPVLKPNPLLFIIGAVLAVTGILVLALVSPVIGGVLATAGVMTAIMGIVFKKSVKPDDSQLRAELSRLSVSLSALVDEKDSISQKLSDLDLKLQDAKIKLLADNALLEEKEKELLKLEEGLANDKLLLAEAENKFLIHVSSLKAVSDISQAERVISAAGEELKTLEGTRQRISILSDHSGCDSAEQAKARLESIISIDLPSDISEEELDCIKENFRARSDSNGKMRSEISAMKAQLKTVAESTPAVSVLRLKEKELGEKIEDYNAFGQRLDMTLEVLEEAFRELRKSYSGELEARTAEIFSLITDKKYTSVNVSKSFDLGVTSKEAFGLKDSAYLSAGTEDQLYLSLRLAIAELMTEQVGSLPLFMDDPLAQYDDKRMIHTVEFLSQYAKDRQLILFTCHNQIADAAGANKVNIISL